MPAIVRARGMVRRASLISSPINEPVSTPPNAKKIVDQKIAFLKSACGMRLSEEKLVAEPWYFAKIAASISSTETGIHAPREQQLFNHFPCFSPTMFNKVISASHPSAKSMKYVPLLVKCSPRLPIAKRALPAPKYSTAGKYGRLLIQYDQAAI